ncbi:hypothetical protein AKJ09_09014 [Labilithrix luteola]|uniref:Uncharacterized protein n=1 Tax=Labilithrix luteola TaxID=1391654 RepID=A0A0K1Q980_9BACT|nr:hypothetical protein AKJ09_09014 [Labilithrix luteola]
MDASRAALLIARCTVGDRFSARWSRSYKRTTSRDRRWSTRFRGVLRWKQVDSDAFVAQAVSA